MTYYIEVDGAIAQHRDTAEAAIAAAREWAAQGREVTIWTSKGGVLADWL